jgi:hypothetical protein
MGINLHHCVSETEWKTVACPAHTNISVNDWRVDNVMESSAVPEQQMKKMPWHFFLFG